MHLTAYCGFAMLWPGDFAAPRGRFTEPGGKKEKMECI
jgi:hypothetical protein